MVRELTSSDEELTSAREPPLPVTVARKASSVTAAPSIPSTKENDATQTSEREEQPPLAARSVLGDSEDERGLLYSLVYCSSRRRVHASSDHCAQDHDHEGRGRRRRLHVHGAVRDECGDRVARILCRH